MNKEHKIAYIKENGPCRWTETEEFKDLILEGLLDLWEELPYDVIDSMYSRVYADMKAMSKE